MPSTSETGQRLHGLSPDDVREAERHVETCAECGRKVSTYRQLVGPSSKVVVSGAAPRGSDCPYDEDVDWHEVAAGLWPELKAKQLIMHAALCDHCGPLLRAATSVDPDPTPQEEKLLAELKAPSRPIPVPQPVPPQPSRWQIQKWLVPADRGDGDYWRIRHHTVVVVGSHSPGRSLPNSPSTPTSSTLKEISRWTFTRTRSRSSMNGLRRKSPFSLALPASPAVPGEERPYRLEGARLVPVERQDRCLHRLSGADGTCESGGSPGFSGRCLRRGRSRFYEGEFSLQHGRGIQGRHLVRARADLRSGFSGRK